MTARITMTVAAFLAALAPHHHKHIWHAPVWWLKQATCIHDHEGAWDDNTGYYGGLQFLRSTWENAGGAHYAAFDHPGDSRYPFTASPREQLYRAWVVYRRDGNSWREWGTAGACGLR
jgi:hypothetical protein